MEPTDPRLEDLLATARQDPDVAAVLLFGSAARGEPHRDLDVALFRSPRAASDAWALGERYHDPEERLDVHVFEAMPLHLQVRVLGEGRALHVRDEDALYEAACRAVRAWDDFRPFYEAYLEGAGLA